MYSGLSGVRDLLGITGTRHSSPRVQWPRPREFGRVPVPHKLQCQCPLSFGVDPLFRVFTRSLSEEERVL